MQNVESLFDLSARVYALVAARNISFAECLPWHVKSVLLRLFAGRGLLSSPSLQALCHPEVEKLNLDGSTISDDSLAAISRCKQLMFLNMPNAFVSLPALLNTFVHLSNLRVLTATCCPALDDRVLSVIGSRCLKLTTLDLSKCIGVGTAGLKALSRLSSLTYLDISYTSVGDEGVESLCKGKCQNSLIELTMNSCPNLTPAISSSIILLRKLQYLSFMNCPQLMDSSWIEVLENLPVARDRGVMKQLSFTVSMH